LSNEYGTEAFEDTVITPEGTYIELSDIKDYLPWTSKFISEYPRTKNGKELLWCVRSACHQMTLAVLDNGVTLVQFSNKPEDSYLIPYASDSGESSGRLSLEQAAKVGERMMNETKQDWGKYEYFYSGWAPKPPTEATLSAGAVPNKSNSASWDGIGGFQMAAGSAQGSPASSEWETEDSE